jgi:hypothetical protein
MPTRNESQTWEYLRGDLAARRSGLTDLRNDHAGDQMKQAQSIILRYLETLPAQATVNVETMAEDISRHWPFHGENEQFFRSAVDALKKDGWIRDTKGELELDKVARVTRRFLASVVSNAR